MKNVIEKYLGNPSSIEIKHVDGTRQKFELSPLAPEDLPKLYEIMDLATNRKMTKETLEKIAALGVKCLKPNYPKVDESKLKEFVMRNAITFADTMWLSNLGIPTISTSKSALDKIKEKQNANR